MRTSGSRQSLSSDNIASHQRGVAPQSLQSVMDRIHRHHPDVRPPPIGGMLPETLDLLRMHPDDPHQILSCVIQIHDALAPSPASLLSSSSTTATATATTTTTTTPTPSAIVNAHLASAAVVRLLQDVMQRHRDQEEIQWVQCRILAMASRVSRPFQCQAAALDLRITVRAARAAHPESHRVLAASLNADHAMLLGLELPQRDTASLFHLVSEMLEIMDRYLGGAPSREVSIAPHEDVSSHAVASFRVLHAVFASSRVAACLRPETAQQYAAEILDRMPLLLRNPRVLENAEAVRVWLSMARLQLRQQPSLAFTQLFQVVEHEQARPAESLWTVTILRHWAHDPGLVCDVCAVLTHVFAVPERALVLLRGTRTANGVDPVPRLLLVKSGLFALLCDLLDDLARDLEEDNTAEDSKQSGDCGRTEAAVLELVRVLRMWSCVPDMAAWFPEVTDVWTRLLPWLGAQLTRCASALKDPGSSSVAITSSVRLLLEIAILLRQLSTFSVRSRISSGRSCSPDPASTRGRTAAAPLPSLPKKTVKSPAKADSTASAARSTTMTTVVKVLPVLIQRVQALRGPSTGELEAMSGSTASGDNNLTDCSRVNADSDLPALVERELRKLLQQIQSTTSPAVSPSKATSSGVFTLKPAPTRMKDRRHTPTSRGSTSSTVSTASATSTESAAGIAGRSRLADKAAMVVMPRTTSRIAL